MTPAKEAAARRAVEFVESGMVVGLGTGSTAYFALLALAGRIEREGLEIRGVASSLETEAEAHRLGIPLIGLERVERIDVTIDGADEVDPELRLIKGGGGALLREKVLASISDREVVVVDSSKLVDRLGVRFLLPVEVVPFARPAVARHLARLDAKPALRMHEEGEPFRTDNGNQILDCRFEGGIADPVELDRRLNAIPGLVENGLFLDLVDVLVVGGEDGVTEIRER